MKKRTTIISEVQDVIGPQFGYFDDEGDWREVDWTDEDALIEAANALGLTPVAVKAIAFSIDTAVETIAEAVHNDLVSLWDRRNGSISP